MNKKKSTHKNIGLTPFEKQFAQFLAYVITQDDLNEDKYEWREYAEDGSEYGLFPEDFEDEFDYFDALEEAKEAEEALRQDLEAQELQRLVEQELLEESEDWKSHLSDEALKKAEVENLDIDNYDSEAELIEAADELREFKENLNQEIQSAKSFSKLSHDAKIQVLGAACCIDRGPYSSKSEYDKDVKYFSELHQIEDQKALESYQLGYTYQAYIDFYELFASVYIRPKDYKNIYEYKTACEKAAKEITALQEIYRFDKSRARRNHARELFQIKYGLGICYASEQDKQADIDRLLSLIKLSEPVHKAL